MIPQNIKKLLIQ